MMLEGAPMSLIRKLCLLIFAPLALGCSTHVSPSSAQRTTDSAPPNIVFILLDDLRFDAMGFMTKGLETPNIDRLAREGAQFETAVVTTALCSPSRATLLTGRTTANHGIIDNNNASEAGLVYFPSYLQKAGYTTAFFGKWHMGQSSDAPRPGFDKWVSFRGQGTYFPTDGLSPRQIAAGERQMLNVDGKGVPRAGYITDELTDYAMDWLKTGRDKRKPFLLFLSHKAVHSDMVPPERYRTQYETLDIPLPDTMADTPENRRGKPMWVQNQRNSWHGVDFPYHASRDLRSIMRDYYRTLSPVDESLGRIFAELQASGLDRNTIIVFTSDNGFLFGEHGLIDKRNAYEPSIRVPLLVWAPGRAPAGLKIPNRIRNLDLAPTLLELAGVTPPKGFEGLSFVPLLTGAVKPADWTSPDLIYSYFWEWTFPHTPTTFAIISGATKYIQYHGVWDTEEIYDLANDPDERNNLIADPAWRAARVELRRKLFQGLAGKGGAHVVPYSERNAEGVVWRNPDGADAADFPERWLKPPDRPDRLSGAFPETAPPPPR